MFETKGAWLTGIGVVNIGPDKKIYEKTLLKRRQESDRLAEKVAQCLLNKQIPAYIVDAGANKMNYLCDFAVADAIKKVYGFEIKNN